jgi:hypothetical protein
MVDAFYQNKLKVVLHQWQEAIPFPSMSVIKSAITDVLFLSKGDSTTQLARKIMEWEKVETEAHTHTNGHPAEAV